MRIDVVMYGLSVGLIFKKLQARLSYFGVENVIEWVCYVTAILFVLDFTPCQDKNGIRLSWQWQVGTVSVTLSWLNLLSNVRKFPFLGIYVVMFSDVLQSFLKVSIIVLLFIFAFAFGFYALFAYQANFTNVGYSMIKTAVMTVGEFEFDDLFFDNKKNEGEEQLPYEHFTFFFFICFVVIMPVLIMNLLVR